MSSAHSFRICSWDQIKATQAAIEAEKSKLVAVCVLIYQKDENRAKKNG
jgi:hypothetical protein